MPKTLLLADDSVVIQKLVALSFANEDVELVTVYDGDEAITKANERKPDLVLADVVMPGKNGYEVCEAIKQNPELAHVPVLLLTGTFEAFDEERARRAGSNGQVTKPFEAQALVERVNALLAAERPMAAPAVEAPAADFFDETLDAGGATPAAEDFVFAEPAPVAEPSPATPLAVDPLLDGGDRTVAIMPEAPASSDPLADFSGQETITASGFIQNPGLEGSAVGFDDSLGSRVTEPGPVPEADPFGEPIGATDPLAAGADDAVAATMLADDVFDLDKNDAPSAGLELGGAEPMDATVLADGAFGEAADSPLSANAISGSDLELGAPAQSGEDMAGARTLLADDLFGDDLAGPDPGISVGSGTDDFEFGSPAPATLSSPIPAELDLAGESLDLVDPGASMPEAQLDPKGSSGYDVSSSDLGNPFADAPESLAAPSEPIVTAPLDRGTAAPAPAPAATAPIQTPDRDLGISATPAPIPFPAPEVSLEPEPIAAASSHSAPESNFDSVAGRSDSLEVSASGSLSASAAQLSTDLSDVMKDRIHETLEKVAWEAFADLSDSIVRQVLEKVERVAWEVIPQMAETLIQEEIRKIKGEREE